MKNLLPALLACVAVCGCTPITPYRAELAPGAGPCAAPSDCSDAALIETPEYLLGIVEFDDQGALQSRRSKTEILNQIRPLAVKKEGVLIVAFAHGWLNNASSENGNLRDFQTLLSEVAEDDQPLCSSLDTRGKRRSCLGRKVVGVYLGWRGLSATVQPFKALSFWNRKSRAHRVGQDGATEVLADLAKIRAKGDNNRLVFIGHSFGGALIYSATYQLLMKDAAFVEENKSVHRTTATLVILVNPAFEAAPRRCSSGWDDSSPLSFGSTIPVDPSNRSSIGSRSGIITAIRPTR